MNDSNPNPTAAGKAAPVLVTGAAGTIGHRLCLRLAERGVPVRAVDCAYPRLGYRPFHRELLQGKVEWMDGDVCDPAVAARAVAGVSAILHLAGQGGHAESMANPLLDLRLNLEAVESLLEAVRASPARPRFVLGSTRQLYGRVENQPVRETEPVRILDVNAVHKAAAEEMVLLYHRVHEIPGVVLRLTNVLGPGMRIQDSRQGFCGGWIRALLENRPFEVWGGAQIRDLVHTDDAAGAFHRAGLAGAAPGQVFNVASGRGISLRELADRLVASHGSGSYQVRDLPEAQRRIDIGDFVADISKAERQLDWRPAHTVDTLIADTLAYYRRHAARYLDDGA